jgi:transcriptional regulator with XRE-family HTH domain
MAARTGRPWIRLLAMSPRRARPVSESWLAEARSKRKELGYTLKELGEALAEKVGRAKPYSIPAVNDVLQGRGYSAEMVAALASLLDLEMPPAVGGGDDDELIEWAETGAKLKRLSPSHFQRILSSARKLVTALEEFERG